MLQMLRRGIFLSFTLFITLSAPRAENIPEEILPMGEREARKLIDEAIQELAQNPQQAAALFRRVDTIARLAFPDESSDGHLSRDERADLSKRLRGQIRLRMACEAFAFCGAAVAIYFFGQWWTLAPATALMSLQEYVWTARAAPVRQRYYNEHGRSSELHDRLISQFLTDFQVQKYIREHGKPACELNLIDAETKNPNG